MLDERLNLQISPKLSLRQVALTDANEVFVLIERSRVFLDQFESSVADLRTLDDVQKFLEKHERLFQSGSGFGACLIFENQIAGIFGIHHLDSKNQKAEVGYWLGQPFAGKGLAFQSLSAVVKYSFEKLQLNRLEAKTATTNQPSIRLLERVGFQREGTLRQNYFVRGRFVDDYLYSLLKSEFLKEIG